MIDIILISFFPSWLVDVLIVVGILVLILVLAIGAVVLAFERAVTSDCGIASNDEPSGGAKGGRPAGGSLLDRKDH